MKLSNGIKVYCKSMGKVFPVQHIAKSDDEANQYCEKHRNCGVIAQCDKLGLVFIADLYPIKVPSDSWPDANKGEE